MAALERVGDLEIEQNLAQRRREWTIQRIGWVMMALFALAALLGKDFSLINAFIVILTLVGIDIGLSVWKQRSPRMDSWLDGVPLVLVEDGQPLKERMAQARVDDSDILEAARELQGLERMDQIKYAVLERAGHITIVPKQPN